MSPASKNSTAVILGVCIAVGMIISTYLISQVIYAVKASERYVTVKGFA